MRLSLHLTMTRGRNHADCDANGSGKGLGTLDRAQAITVRGGGLEAQCRERGVRREKLGVVAP